jgi:tetratricopeptide (TPR) repeat protein
MLGVFELPPDLIPRELTYCDESPTIVDVTIGKCLSHLRNRNIDQAIRCVEQARALAQANRQHVDETILCVWMADIYREAAQLGPALKYCQYANASFRLQPDYEHRDQAEGVIAYLRGLLHHLLGSYAEAQADYKRATASFDGAKEHWETLARRSRGQAKVRYYGLASKCEMAIKWINALCRYLERELSPVTSEAKIYITVIDKQDYELIRLGLRDYEFPTNVKVGDQLYGMHNPGNGVPLNTKLEVRWNVPHLALRVLENKWAGPYSTCEDYILARRQRLLHQEEGAGVLWDTGQRQWEFGMFTRDLATGEIRFHPLSSLPPSVVIGGTTPHEEHIGEYRGILRALLKPL